MYCKLLISQDQLQLVLVLIVAKCIVNLTQLGTTIGQIFVLIVAKCIVNQVF